MERTVRSNGIDFFKSLSKATSFSISNRPHYNWSNAHHHRKGFSTITSIIPAAEACRRELAAGSFRDPTSSEVSCVGRIMNKQKNATVAFSRSRRQSPPTARKVKMLFAVVRMFRRRKARDAVVAEDDPVDDDDSEEDRCYYHMDESSDEEDEFVISRSAPIMTAGLGGVDLEPRKEVNLWKRRRRMTSPPPTPLQLG